tara:strand:+ start:285 stop:842 length:558 start_codon:yes stop_codon:yes gene_type:complete
MATISLIQGTDSLSSSRVTLNDNFIAINDELNLVTAIVDPTTTDITGVAALSATSVTIAGGTSATFTATGNTLTADTVVDGKSTLNGGLVYGVEAIGVLGMPNALAFESSTYVIDALTAPSVQLNAANSGQEITLIADAGIVNISNPTDVAGATASIVIAQNGTLTLRYVGSSWYVIGSFLTTIV